MPDVARVRVRSWEGPRGGRACWLGPGGGQGAGVGSRSGKRLWGPWQGVPGAARTRGNTSLSLSRLGSAHTALQLKNRRTLPGSPERTAGGGLLQDRREAGPASRKRRHHLSPEARAPLSGPLSRLFNHVGALDVALGELRAPGGAFLPLPARGPQPAASQRAWLSWQLAQAGATLHGAGAALDALLAAAQPRPACPQPSLPAPPRP